MERNGEKSGFRLASHVYVCIENDCAIILDARNDAYVGLNAEQVCALSMLVEGWPPRAQAQELDPALASTFAEMLRARGLLVGSVDSGKAYRTPALARPEQEFLPWDEACGTAVRAHHVWRFVISVCTTAIRMRRWPLHMLIERYRRQKATLAAIPVADAERTRSLLAAFLNLRVFVYRRGGRCLFDSLVLIDFLSRYGVFPSWVIGVRSVPFAAHSWVQHEAAVLNGTPAFVGAFSPILVI